MRPLLFIFLLASFSFQQSFGQTPISPATWGGSPSNPSTPSTSDFAPLPASTTPGAAVVTVSQFDRVGVTWNTAGGRYNSKGWGPASSSTVAEVGASRYLTFTVTNNATTELRITGFAVSAGQASGTGPTTFGLAYKIGTAATQYFPGSVGGPSPNFNSIVGAAPVFVCAGQTVRFYLCGWGGSSAAGTWSINANGANLTASFATAVNATASSNSPVMEGSTLNLISTPSTGITPYTYSWSGPLSYSATTQSPSIPATTLPMAGVYSVTVTDAWGCSVVRPTTVVINPAGCTGTPAAGSAVPVTGFFCGSGSTTLNLTGGASGAGITYQWSSSNTSTAPGADISGATSASYTTPALTTTTYYWLTTTCTTSSLTAVSSVGVVTVNPVPVVAVTPPGGVYCTATTGLDLTASGATTYSWAPATGLSATTGPNVTATPATATIYTVTGTSSGCSGTATVSVGVLNPPTAIAGLSSLCLGATIPLSNTVSGGTWSSANSAVATIDAATGILSAVAQGVTVVNYTTGCGADATTTITAISAPGAISGASSVCSGLSTPLSNLALAGTWSSDNTTVATVSATGVVTGGAAGAAVITYGTGCGTDATFTITTISAPSAISGASSVCMGFTTPMSNTVAGGVWSSSNTAVATVDAAGLVTSGVAGAATIRYSTGCGTDATKLINVISAPSAIGGASTVCVGASTTLSEAITGGTWSSSNTTVATVNATGVVFGAGAGSATINYSTGCGTDVSHVMTVIAAPVAITGPSSVCVGSSIALTNTVTGGTWSSNATTIATVNTTGSVAGVAAGTVTIVYGTGCGTDATKVLSVIASPTAIGGAATVCSGLSAQLSESVTGGTWTSSVTTVATVSATGLVTGGVAGTTVINYSTGCGTDVTHTITTIAAPAAIGGAATVCTGATVQLSQSVAMGTWSSSNTNVATVNATGLVTGIIAGPVTITYGTGCGTNATKAITVIAPPAGISGASSMCSGFNIQLSNTVSGGTWTSSNLGVATVNSTGFVSSVAAGNTVIRYGTGCGTDATKTISVIAAPATITGLGAVCSGGVIALANTSAGGTWSSSNSSVATIDAFGNVWGVTQGSTVIRYATGCGADATKTVTVLIAPGGISGSSTVCIGFTLPLSNVTLSGTWSSSNTSVATINGAGLVTSVTPGSTTITYSTGCGSDQNKVVTVIPNPGIISGPSSVCSGGGVITLSNTVAGGGWNSSNTPVASVNATGDVTGGIAGTAVISYTTGCGTDVTSTVTVIPVPGVTLGTTSVCPGATSTLTNGASGGLWSSSNTNIATVDASGSVSAITPGTANIIYSTGCGASASVSFIVNSSPAAPAPVLGTATVCFGGSTALSSITPGGVWSSDNTLVATVSNVGAVSTIAAGTANISYTVTNMCGSASSFAMVTAESPLMALPAITGTTSFCEGTFASLSNTMAGGAWSSSNTSIATVNIFGLVAGVTAGNAVIAYTASNTCNTASVTTVLTINPLPAPAPIIGSTAAFCEGTTIALSDPTPGGTWSSNITTIATVNGAGVVTGVSGGSSTIFYALTNGCGTVASTLIVTVDPMPVLSPVTGNLVVCAGSTTQLSDTATSGAWSSGNTTLATVSNTGLVTALSAGVVPVSYSAVNSCGVIASVASVTVTTTPILGPITGPSTVCIGSSINLANTTPGGTWSTDVVSIANVNNLGVVVGFIAGTDTIRYRVSNSCGTSMVAKGIEVLPASACDPVKAGEIAATPSELRVFPNPNAGEFIWNLLSATNEPVDVVVTNVVGKTVKQYTSVTNKDNSTILDVPGGVYFLSVRTLAGTYNAKITITR